MGKISAWWFSWGRVPLTFNKSEKILSSALAVSAAFLAILGFVCFLTGKPEGWLIPSLAALSFMGVNAVMCADNLAKQLREQSKAK